MTPAPSPSTSGSSSSARVQGSGPVEPVACAGCDEAVEAPPLSWSREVTADGLRWLCPTCTREHVRSIEARLDPAWW